jgi:GNAT superfamily N-acetyltransferase
VAAGDHGDVVVGDLDDRWVAAWAQVGGGDGARPTAERVLAQLGDRGGFAIARDGDGVVGVGIGVIDEGWLGLYSVTVAAHARRRGVGRAVVAALGCWGGARGAGEVYLQVELDNPPALAFWAALDFRLAHRYIWRRPR